jgi:hypothetical protein
MLPLRWLAGLLLAILLGGCASAPPPASHTAASCRPRAAAPAAAPGAVVLLHEEFTDPAASRMQQQHTPYVRYAVESGAYRIAVEQPELLAWSLLEPSYENVRIEAEATLIAGAPTSASSLIFRYHDANNFYLFNVAHNGYYSLERFAHGTHTVLIDWTHSNAIARLPTATPTPGAPPPMAHNTLRVELRDDHIALAVNGTPLDHTLDDTLRRGQVALAVNTATHGPAVVCFDRLTITAVGVP